MSTPQRATPEQRAALALAIYAVGDWVHTPDGDGRIVRVITHPTLPTAYRVMVRGVDYDYRGDQLKPDL